MENEIKFEKALEKLEKIVDDLESGNMPLEDALKRYEEGVGLARACTKKLEQVETKIEVLTKTLNQVGDAEASDSEAGPSKSSRKKGKRPQADDDDLLI